MIKPNITISAIIATTMNSANAFPFDILFIIIYLVLQIFTSNLFSIISAIKFPTKSKCSVVRALPPTGDGLAAGRGFTNVRAGAKLPKSDKTFCGQTPRLAPNRLLQAGVFTRCLLFVSN
jgi:hypothetical protein